MPMKVQTLQRRVAPGALPAAQVSAQAGRADFGGLEADVIGQIGGQIQQVGQREQVRESAVLKRQTEFQDRKDRLQAKELTNATSDWMRDYRAGMKSKTGSETAGITEQAIKDIDKAIKTFGESASNDATRLYYNASISPKREVTANQYSSYEASEHIRAEQGALSASIENTMRDAAEWSNDPVGLRDLRLTLDDDVTALTAGMLPAQAKNVKAETVSMFHESVTNAKVTTNAADAKEYYKIHKKDILPDKREEIEETLEIENTLQVSQLVSDEIVRAEETDTSKWAEMARTYPYKGTDEQKAKQRQATVKAVKDRKTVQDQEDKDGKEEVYLSAADAIWNAPNLIEANKIVDSHPDAVERVKLQGIANGRQKRMEKPIVTDRPKQLELLDKIASGEIDKRSQLLEYSEYLSTAAFNNAETRLVNKAKTDKGIKVGEISLATAKNSLSLSMGKTYNPEEDSKMLEFILPYLDQAAREKGDDLSAEEARKITSNLLVSGEHIGGGWFGGDPDQTYKEAVETGTQDKWLPDVNDEDEDGGQEDRLITEAFKNKGIITDNETLKRLYKKNVTLGHPLSDTEITLFNNLVDNARRNQ